ncbi:MAG: dienelactone hydrolase family protein [Ferruginibacter sp.]
MQKFLRKNLLLCGIAAFTACNNTNEKNNSAKMEEPKTPVIVVNPVSYPGDSVTMNGFVAYDSASSVKRPVVLLVHEWWGVNDYAVSRAKQLAELGYLAMAVDMYGNGAQGNDPDAAGKLAMPFYKDPQMAKRRFDAALEKIKTYPQADAGKIAAIGYCFGGTQVLNMAALGENLDGVVSFHGGLETVAADKNSLKAKILICHGEADSFVPAEQVAKFRKNLDSIGASYTFKSYAGGQHAFTNPAATENGLKFKLPISYNAAADTASWNDMKVFLQEVFK